MAGERHPERRSDPGVRIGHVHLKVADLDRALGFYCGLLGFDLMQRYGTQAAFLSAGGYHHHIGLNTWESLGGSPPPPGSAGLYHTAILYPTRAALADALRRLMAAGIPLDGAFDHGVNEALYLRDPDQNGVDPMTLSAQIAKLTERFGLAHADGLRPAHAAPDQGLRPARDQPERTQ